MAPTVSVRLFRPCSGIFGPLWVRVWRYTGVSVLSRYLQWTIIVSQPILDIAIYRPTRFIKENTVYC